MTAGPDAEAAELFAKGLPFEHREMRSRWARALGVEQLINARVEELARNCKE